MRNSKLYPSKLDGIQGNLEAVAGFLECSKKQAMLFSMIMAMTEPRPAGVPWIPLLISSSFRSVCLGYPCVFIPCAVGAISAARKKNHAKELKFAKSAFYYFLFVVFMGILTSLTAT